MKEQLEVLSYNPEWANHFAVERNLISEALGSVVLRIDHNGSTAVPGLAAKPIIDIQISVKSLQPMNNYLLPLTGIGYTHVPDPDDSFAPFFHKPQKWPHQYHVHVVEYGGDEERKTLAFRDYLRANSDIREEYGKLKQKLARKYSGNFSAHQSYAEKKTDFISRITEQALKEGYPYIFD